jgi:hypothetical protein
LRKYHLSDAPFTPSSVTSFFTYFDLGRISFSMTPIPYSPICLASIIAARAIKDDAFKVAFESVEALLSRPTLESVDFLPLDWKEEMLDRPIFNISDSTFSDLWHRTCLVSGLRVNPRFYTMRVGAGGRLDGKQILKTLIPQMKHLLPGVVYEP